MTNDMTADFNQRRARAVALHPIGARLAEQGLFDHDSVRAYFHALGENPPVPAAPLGKLIRRQVFTYDEIGEVYLGEPSNRSDRPRYLYSLYHRAMSETHHEAVEYSSRDAGVIPAAELTRLRPQPLGTAPFDPRDIRLPAGLIELIRPYLSNGFIRGHR